MDEFILKAFKTWDKNGDGEIDKEEWLTEIKEKIEVNESKVDEIWARFDLDGNGYLDYEEFSQMFQELLPNFDLDVRIRLFWTTVDTNGDGVLSSEEFKEMVENMELDQECAEMIRSALNEEVDDNGKIGYKEFYNVMKHILA